MYMMTRKSVVGSGREVDEKWIRFWHHEMIVSPQIRLLSESGHPQIRLCRLCITTCVLPVVALPLFFARSGVTHTLQWHRRTLRCSCRMPCLPTLSPLCSDPSCWFSLSTGTIAG